MSVVDFWGSRGVYLAKEKRLFNRLVCANMVRTNPNLKFISKALHEGWVLSLLLPKEH